MEGGGERGLAHTASSSLNDCISQGCAILIAFLKTHMAAVLQTSNLLVFQAGRKQSKEKENLTWVLSSSWLAIFIFHTCLFWFLYLCFCSFVYFPPK